MIKIGQINTLEVVKKVDFGVFLDGDDYGNILLPARNVPKNTEVGDKVEAFLFFDSENEIVATTETPLAQVGEWAVMKVVGLNSIGAFVDWGITKKDLLIPFSEQLGRFKEGQSILVYVYTDKASGRIVGTTKFNKWLDNTPATYKKDEQVDLLIAEITDLGFKAIINGQHWGLLFKTESFGKLFVGKKLKGYIKTVREDGKIDLSLQRQGKAKMDDLSDKIITALEKKDGFIPVSDKSSPDEIFAVFRTSKGTFKKTIGGLYKQGLITIEREGIRLVDKS
ncbi:S1-like domain-containing RNA-binding protein [Vibrio sp. Of7-15]|uniref:CvfB family protein n=1 Tax=Vibrio sp. Of7-15 TaxID=2724879 RepID=UPI001EF2917A|nr:S1-like domain-containing RNA-binding protein [Vibrio sp. Of7-15]MCG7496304.1 S1-like domain-containing RNA-binding protein [Vibrio sp. Of7-15]